MARRGIKLKGWDENDALTGWRHDLYWKPGQRKAIKRQFNRRERRTERFRRELDD